MFEGKINSLQSSDLHKIIPLEGWKRNYQTGSGFGCTLEFFNIPLKDLLFYERGIHQITGSPIEIRTQDSILLY